MGTGHRSNQVISISHVGNPIPQRLVHCILQGLAARFHNPHCGAENFYDAATPQLAGGQLPACWSCTQAVQLPGHLRLAQHPVMLNRDTQLFPHHVDDQRLYDFSQPVAAVIQHPTDPRIWGLKNM